MVQVGIYGITTVEAWERTVMACIVGTIVIHHALWHVVTFENDVAISIHGHRSGLALCSEVPPPGIDLFLAHSCHSSLNRVVVVLIDTQVLEAIDGTERVVQLHAAQRLTVGIALDPVLVFQDIGVHLQDFITVVTEIHVHIHHELALLDEAVGVDVELPTRVAHLTVVVVRHGGKTCI